MAHGANTCTLPHMHIGAFMQDGGAHDSYGGNDDDYRGYGDDGHGDDGYGDDSYGDDSNQVCAL
jgi:hypothetical protein